jgi:short-subunit dehydrogenase involved in D-alanine esterification of teichoic acids
MNAAYASLASDALTGHGFGVSGGGTHRGRAISLALAAAGGEVLISGRRKDPLL